MTENVLFVCEDNSILSPMAEAFTRRHCKSIFKVFSAGMISRPIHLYTFQVMEEIGYDLYNAQVKNISDLRSLDQVDYLITLAFSLRNLPTVLDDRTRCRLHWSFKNPLLDQRQNEGLRSVNHIPSQPRDPQKIIPVSAQDLPNRNTGEIRARFRRIRDEIEVQVMNWLEEQGIGPLWWRR